MAAKMAALENITGFLLKVKSFQKRGYINPPPLPPLYHGGSVTLLVRPRVNIYFVESFRIYYVSA